MAKMQVMLVPLHHARGPWRPVAVTGGLLLLFFVAVLFQARVQSSCMQLSRKTE